MAAFNNKLPSSPMAVPVPVAVPVPAVSDPRMARLAAIASTFEIRADWVSRLRALESFDIVALCDDSGSMASQVTSPDSDPYAPRATRWSELRSTMSIVVDLAAALSDSGVDVHFLNRPAVLHAHSAADVQRAFDYAPPSGFTPLTRAIQGILGSRSGERDVLLLIATDGEPTDDYGRTDIPSFIAALKSKRQNVFVQIMACTDDDGAIAYLDKVDRTVPRVDVTDDFRSERAQVLRSQGPKFHFSFGDYVVKALLGPVDPLFDSLDSKKKGACTIA